MTSERRPEGRLSRHRDPRGGRRAGTIALAALTTLLVLLAVAQLVLPGLAARSVRDRLRSHGSVASVHVRAFPAVELLWHHADAVAVTLRSFSASPGTVAQLLGDSGDAGRLDVSAATVQIGLLRLHDATLHESGGALSAHGRVTQGDLRAAAPFLRSVVPVVSAGGALTLRGTAGALGFSVSADATVAARDGALVVAPDVPLLAPVTVFANPRVAVTGVSGAAAPGGFTVTVTGRLA
jgi:hypothetical protein